MNQAVSGSRVSSWLEEWLKHDRCVNLEQPSHSSDLPLPQVHLVASELAMNFTTKSLFTNKKGQVVFPCQDFSDRITREHNRERQFGTKYPTLEQWVEYKLGHSEWVMSPLACPLPDLL
jgi:hypothetical protein